MAEGLMDHFNYFHLDSWTNIKNHEEKNTKFCIAIQIKKYSIKRLFKYSKSQYRICKYLRNERSDLHQILYGDQLLFCELKL